MDLVVEDMRWNSIALAQVCERAACAALAGAGLDVRRYEISLLACDDRRIAAFNAQFRGRNVPTNILSWPALDPAGARGHSPEDRDPIFLGDIALAFETCSREAQGGGISFEAHLSHLVAHGVLHLIGHDHQVDMEAEVMENLERKILATLGVADPYS